MRGPIEIRETDGGAQLKKRRERVKRQKKETASAAVYGGDSE